MAENSNSESKGKESATIEELAKKNKVDRSVLEGLKISKTWGTGKRVSEATFKTALKAFLESPADGRKKPENTEKKEGAK